MYVVYLSNCICILYSVMTQIPLPLESLSIHFTQWKCVVLFKYISKKEETNIQTEYNRSQLQRRPIQYVIDAAVCSFYFEETKRFGHRSYFDKLRLTCRHAGDTNVKYVKSHVQMGCIRNTLKCALKRTLTDSFKNKKVLPTSSQASSHLQPVSRFSFVHVLPMCLILGNHAVQYNQRDRQRDREVIMVDQYPSRLGGMAL